MAGVGVLVVLVLFVVVVLGVMVVEVGFVVDVVVVLVPFRLLDMLLGPDCWVCRRRRTPSRRCPGAGTRRPWLCTSRQHRGTEKNN